MSQSRKKNKRNSANYNNKKSMNSNSDDVINKLDGLRTNIKQEQKSISVPSSNNNIKIIAVVIIIIVGGAGFFVLYNPATVPGLSGGNSSGNQTQALVGNFKKDLLAVPLFINNKVSFTFVGGQYCPYCAMERWAIVMALEQYGNFSGLSYFTSAEGSVPTYNFTKATYSSSLIEFQSVDVYNNQVPPNQQPLQSLNGNAKTCFDRYGINEIPFTCIAGSIYRTGAGPSLVFNSFSRQTLSTIQNSVNSKSGTFYDQILTESNVLVQIINQEIGVQTSTGSTTSTTVATNTTG